MAFIEPMHRNKPDSTYLLTPLLQLRTPAQDHNGAPCAILVMLELAEMDALEHWPGIGPPK